MRHPLQYLFIPIIWFICCYSHGAGVSLHIAVAGRAADSLEKKSHDLFEILKEHRDAVNLGATLADSGYNTGHSHIADYLHTWEFHQFFYEYINSTCQGDFTNQHCKKLVASFMGAISQRVFDQMYDRFIDTVSEQIDGEANDSLLFSRDAVVSRFYLLENGYDFANLPAIDDELLQEFYGLLETRYALGRTTPEEFRSIFLTTSYSTAIERSFVDPSSDYALTQLYPWLKANYMNAPGGVKHSTEILVNVWLAYWSLLTSQTRTPLIRTLPEDDGFASTNPEDPHSSVYFFADSPISNRGVYNKAIICYGQNQPGNFTTSKQIEWRYFGCYASGSRDCPHPPTQTGNITYSGCGLICTVHTSPDAYSNLNFTDDEWRSLCHYRVVNISTGRPVPVDVINHGYFIELKPLMPFEDGEAYKVFISKNVIDVRFANFFGEDFTWTFTGKSDL